MLAFIVVAAVLPVAILMWVAHLAAAALFPRTPPIVTVMTGLVVLTTAPLVYFMFGAIGRQAAHDAGVTVSQLEGFLLTMAAVVIVVLAYLLITVPAAQRRDAQTDARVGLWYAMAAERPALRIAVVRSYAMTRQVNGWADIQIGTQTWTAWLTGRCRSGEIVLIECATGVQAARVLDRLTTRESARRQRRARRWVTAA